jgi:peptidylprolyl isomerase
MKVGEIRKLIIPPSLSKRSAYPNFLAKDSTLVYKIEQLEIMKK